MSTSKTEAVRQTTACPTCGVGRGNYCYRLHPNQWQDRGRFNLLPQDRQIEVLNLAGTRLKHNANHTNRQLKWRENGSPLIFLGTTLSEPIPKGTPVEVAFQQLAIPHFSKADIVQFEGIEYIGPDKVDSLVRRQEAAVRAELQEEMAEAIIEAHKAGYEKAIREVAEGG